MTTTPAGLGYSTALPSGDFETYSEAGYAIDPVTLKVTSAKPGQPGGLPAVGTPVYASHPSTEVICFYYDLKDGRGRRPWVPGSPNPVELFAHIAAGGLFAAWNVTFEWWIWNAVCVRRYGWPPLPLDQCRCDMAKSRRFSLPGSLAVAARVLGAAEKDKRGKQLITKLTRPHTPTKNRPAIRWTPATAWADFSDLYAYCDRDVESEDATAALIPDLTPDELAVWKADQVINARGVQVDVETLDAAIDLLGQTERKYTVELATITGGAVGSVNEIAKLGEWLAGNGVHLPDLTAPTVSEALEALPPGAPRRALEIRATLGAANVKKLRTLKLQVSGDGRLRDQYTYCGADRTGRASAGGVQLQNITARGPDTAECEACGGVFNPADATAPCPRCGAASTLWHKRSEWNVEAVEWAVQDVRRRDLDWLELVWGDPIALLCGCLRGLFVAAPGHDLVCVDFSAIEAVGAACLSRCQWRVDTFEVGRDIYLESISRITGTPYADFEAYAAANGTHHPERKRGKIAELASGYGGWIGSWVVFGAAETMNEDEIKEAVLAWRAASPEIVHMWGGQFLWCGPGKWDYRPELHGLEGAAIQAIRNPGTCYSYIDITYGVFDDVMYCRLPSGRYLHYHKPRLHNAQDKLGRGPAVAITFEGYNTNSQKGAVGWVVMETYGARLFENVDQAVCADLQFAAIVRCEESGYPVVMHTHDEAVAEVPEGVGSVEHMAGIMVQRPDWAAWWPIRGAGWRHKRYQKD